MSIARKPKPEASNAGPIPGIHPKLRRLLNTPVAVSLPAPDPTAEAIVQQMGRLAAQMGPLGAFCFQMGSLRTAVEVTVGPVSAVISDGAIDGIRFGHHSTADVFEPTELMEIGAFLVTLGVNMRQAELAKVKADMDAAGSQGAPA